MVSRMAPTPRTLLPTRSPLRNSCASSRACRIRLSSKLSSKVYRHVYSDINHSTSKSVQDLIAVQVVTEVKSALEFLGKTIKDNSKNNSTKYFYMGLEVFLKPANPEYGESVIKAAQEKMKGVASENYVAEIKKIVKEVIVKDYMKAAGNTLKGVLEEQK